MAQLEYGDYYKFLASAGIALLAGAVVVPWMFLREPFDLALEASKIALLTPEAQSIIHTRQHLIALAVRSMPYASGAMAIAGSVLTGLGLYPWRLRQSVRDKGEDLQNEKLTKELRDMSPEQIETKAKNDLEDADEPETSLVAVQPRLEVSKVLAVEQGLLSRIGTCLGSSMKVLTNQRLGSVEYDAIVRPRARQRIIVEIKYIRKGFNRGWLSETFSNLESRMALYSKTFDEGTHGLLIVVIATSHSPLSRKVMELSEDIRRSDSSRLERIRVETIYEADIATMSCGQVRALVMGSSE
jgi:hypothetical protein